MNGETVVVPASTYPKAEEGNDIKNEDKMQECITTVSKESKVTLNSSGQVSVKYLDEDTKCGFGTFRPQWLQQWATPKTFLVIFSLIGIVHGLFFTYRIGIITTLEKRFAFESKISGSIMMVDEITPLLFGLPIGYFGGKTHRPKMIALGMMMCSACCFIFAFPYFIYGPATDFSTLAIKNKTGPEMCSAEFVNGSCEASGRPPTLSAVIMFLIASFLQGFGTLAYHAIGFSYLDDSAKKTNAPLYLAITESLRMVGPMLGFLMASAFLNYSENPLYDPGYGPGDQRWIGAWWLGFVVQGFLLFILSIPVALFPKRLPGKRYDKLKHQSFKGESFKEMCLGIFPAAKRLATNRLYVFLLLNATLSIYGTVGHMLMLPKYMEHQFRLSASDANLYSAPPGLVAVIISVIIGGYGTWKFRPSAKFLTAGMAIMEFIAASGCLVLYFPSCENVQMTNFGINKEGLILTNECNVNCNCTTGTFTPVCGADGKTAYFSPCFAGCSGEAKMDIFSKSKKIYTNCTCVPDPTDYSHNFVTEGYCEVGNCWPQALAYIVTLPSFHFITSLFRIAFTMALLRSINPADKSVALGTFAMIMCFFGWIPYPVTVGSLVDKACLIWEKSCGDTGNCWFYDVDKLNIFLHGVASFFQFLAALCLLAFYLNHKRLRDLYKDEDEDEGQEKSDENAKGDAGTNMTNL